MSPPPVAHVIQPQSRMVGPVHDEWLTIPSFLDVCARILKVYNVFTLSKALAFSCHLRALSPES